MIMPSDLCFKLKSIVNHFLVSSLNTKTNPDKTDTSSAGIPCSIRAHGFPIPKYISCGHFERKWVEPSISKDGGR